MSAAKISYFSGGYPEGEWTIGEIAKGYDGGPPMDSDTRLTRVETLCGGLQNDVQDIRSDLRDIRSEMRGMRSEMGNLRKWIVGTGIAVILGIGGIVATQATWYTYSLDRDRDEWKVAQAKSDARFDQMMKKIDEQGARIDAHLTELRELRHEHDKRLYRLEVQK